MANQAAAANQKNVRYVVSRGDESWDFETKTKALAHIRELISYTLTCFGAKWSIFLKTVEDRSHKHYNIQGYWDGTYDTVAFVVHRSIHGWDEKGQRIKSRSDQ